MARDRVCFWLNLHPTFAWQFLQLMVDLFLDWRITVSWLKDNEVKEATDWMSNTKPQLVCCDPEKWEMIVQVSYCKQVAVTHLSCLGRVNKHCLFQSSVEWMSHIIRTWSKKVFPRDTRWEYQLIVWMNPPTRAVTSWMLLECYNRIHVSINTLESEGLPI